MSKRTAKLILLLLGIAAACIAIYAIGSGRWWS
jgi:hypothetical protein